MSILKSKIYTIIFEAETPAGKAFDIALLLSILISVLVVLLESVHSIEIKYGVLLRNIEWFFTILFTIEYILRIVSVRSPLKYIFSFFGLVDLLSIIPTYLSLILTGAHSLIVIRALRLLRVFRVLKLGRYLVEANTLVRALKASRDKIVVFLAFVSTLVVIMGTVMYLIEGQEHGFTSIPKSIYWAIVTMTTVGYGDIAPQTVFGQFIASIVMIMGYAIIVVPTGIFSAALTHSLQIPINTRTCPNCSREDHREDSSYCRFCGEPLT